MSSKLLFFFLPSFFSSNNCLVIIQERTGSVVSRTVLLIIPREGVVGFISPNILLTTYRRFKSI